MLVPDLLLAPQAPMRRVRRVRRVSRVQRVSRVLEQQAVLQLVVPLEQRAEPTPQAWERRQPSRAVLG